jgi:hypothetical protein
LQLTSIISSYYLCHANDEVTHQSSEGCLADQDLQSVFPKTDDKIASTPLCPDHSKKAQFAICMGEDLCHYAR